MKNREMLHKNPFLPLINLNPCLDKVDIYILYYEITLNFVIFMNDSSNNVLSFSKILS